SGIKSEPTEGQNEAAEENHRDVVAWHRVGTAVAPVFTDTRADYHRHRERAHSAHRVDDSRAGEIAVAVAQVIVGSELRQPSAAPCPVAIERVGARQTIRILLNAARRRSADRTPRRGPPRALPARRSPVDRRKADRRAASRARRRPGSMPLRNGAHAL